MKPCKWLNDEVITFFLNLIVDRSKNEESLPKVGVFQDLRLYAYLMLSNHLYSRFIPSTRFSSLISAQKVTVASKDGHEKSTFFRLIYF